MGRDITASFPRTIGRESRRIARRIVACVCDRILTRLFATLPCANHRTISDTQPGRERPHLRNPDPDPSVGYGVAHVPAALRDTVRGGKNRRRFSINPRGSLSANSHSVFGCAHGPRSASPHDRFDLRSGIPLTRG
jgi:hypothetical protein